MPHYRDVATRSDLGVGFLEAIAENFLGDGALPRHHLRRARERVPVVLHGVGLDLLGPDPLDRDHLRRLRTLADELDAPWVTDHLCWTGAGGRRSHDLLPAPRTSGLLRYAVERVRVVQDALERPFGVENLAAMFDTTWDALSEWDFFAEVVALSGCGVLLDVNNVFVAAHNQGTDPHAFFAAVPRERILYVHLAGHAPADGTPIVDTHDAPVRDEVWALYAQVWETHGPFPTLVEWDASIPSYDRCLAEVQRAARERGATPPRVEVDVRVGAARAWDDPVPEDDVATWQRGLMDLLHTPLVWTPPRVSADVDAYPVALVESVRDVAGLSPRVRLRTYHQQVWFRWLEALQGSFPTVAALTGLWAFNQLATAHLRRCPPVTLDLGRIGDGLLDTLVGTPWDAPIVREAVAVDRAFDALITTPPTPTWTPPTDPAVLMGVRLRLAPTFHRLDLRWPLPAHRDGWRVRTDEDAVDAPAPQPLTWLVGRTPDLSVGAVALDPVATTLLDALTHAPLGVAVAQVESTHADLSDLASRVQRTLAAGVRSGWWISYDMETA